MKTWTKFLSAGLITSSAALFAADAAKHEDSSKADAPKHEAHDAAKAEAPKPDADGFYPLFDGKTLDGWKVGKNAETFNVAGGELVVKGPGPAHLFYAGPVHKHDFTNFHLKAELMTMPHANSGIYFQTKYQAEGWPAQGFEAQVNQTHGDPKKTGGLYGVKDVMNQSPVKDGEWYKYEVIVQDKHVVIKINDKVTTDWTQPADWKPPAGMEGRFIQHGTVAIQGHDPKSESHYRSISIKPLD